MTAGLLVVAVVWLLVARPFRSERDQRPSGTAEGSEVGAAQDPYPYSTPAPERTPTAVDGVYERTLSVKRAGGSPVPCRRCAPYRLEAGAATLELDRGWFRVEHPAAGFRSVGHFFVRGDEITLVNDPNCSRDRGVYAWSLENGRLRFVLRRDPCPFDGLRSRYLTVQPWRDA